MGIDIEEEGEGAHIISFTVKSSPFINKIIFVKSVIGIGERRTDPEKTGGKDGAHGSTHILASLGTL